MQHERPDGIESRMLFVQAIPLVGAGLTVLVVHHVFIVDTVRVDEGTHHVHVGEGALGGVTEDESGHDREGVLTNFLVEHSSRLGEHLP